jgi:hypothetical protein
MSKPKELTELDKLTDEELLDEMTEHGMPLIYRLAITDRLAAGREAIEMVKELEKEYLLLRDEWMQKISELDFKNVSLEKEVERLKENQHDENCDTRDIMITGKPCNCYLKYKQQAAADQNDHLYERFSRCYQVNKWEGIKSGFDNPLDFYIHEIWKRDAKVAAGQRAMEAITTDISRLSAEATLLSDFMRL